MMDLTTTRTMGLAKADMRTLGAFARSGRDSGATQRSGAPGRCGAGMRVAHASWEQTNKITPDFAKRRSREIVYRRRSASRRILARHAGHGNDGVSIKLPRCARCGQPVDSAVGIMTDGERARFTGTMLCESIWACPLCSAIIRRRYTHEVDVAVKNHAEQLREKAEERWKAEHGEDGEVPATLLTSDGFGSYAFGTLTIRHNVSMPLKMTIKVVTKGWSKLIAGSPWTKAKKRYGIRGFVRAVEVTYGRNGWHPHIHFLLFLDSDLDEEQRKKMDKWLLERWQKMVVRVAESYVGNERDKGNYHVAPDWLTPPEKIKGKDVKPNEHGLLLVFRKGIDGGKELGAYVTKMQFDKNGALAKELSRGDLKDGRGDSVNPFELLDEGCLGLSDVRREALWLEYWGASFQVRCITWSGDIKKNLKVDKTLAEELDERAGEDSGFVGYVMPDSAYRTVFRESPEKLAAALVAAEREDWREVARLLPGGVILTDEQQDDIADGKTKPRDYLPRGTLLE